MNDKYRYLIRYVTKDNLNTSWESISDKELKKLSPKIHRIEKNNLTAAPLDYEYLAKTTATFNRTTYILTPAFDVRCFELIEE